MAELETWLRRSGMTKEQLAERSGHNAAHVLSLFTQAEPNPSLRLFLDLVEKSGARFHGVPDNRSVAVVARMKEVMAREKISSISALAKVTGMNRSQLSTMFNEADPNPSLVTFDRLVVTLGAERDFTIVKFLDQQVAEAVAVGLEEIKTAAKSHLHVVPPPAPGMSLEEQTTYRRQAEYAARQAEAREEALKAKVEQLKERISQLHEMNVALEKQRDDKAAEIVRLRGLNANLERLRAENAAEIARLHRENREYQDQHTRDADTISRLSAGQDLSLGKKILIGLGGVAMGFGIGLAVAGASSGGKPPGNS